MIQGESTAVLCLLPNLSLDAKGNTLKSYKALLG